MNEKSAGAVVFRRGNHGEQIEYLLLLYPAGHWDFVKGNVEEGENDKDAVIRELKEETGIADAEFVDGFHEDIKYFYRRDGNLIRKEVVFFLAETAQREVKISFEHTDFRWLGFNEAYGMVTHKNAKEILKKAHELITKKKSLRDFE